MASAIQIAPSASRQQPSGAAPSTVAQVRRSVSEPSDCTVNALSRAANDSPMINVPPSGVMTVPFGNARSSAATLTDRRTWATVEGAAPDGCCLDADGAIWMADAIGRRVVRVLEGGEITDTVAVSDPNGSYACMLGGDDRRTLYICTAPSSSPSDTESARGGRIESVRVEVPGAGLP